MPMDLFVLWRAANSKLRVPLTGIMSWPMVSPWVNATEHRHPGPIGVPLAPGCLAYEFKATYRPLSEIGRDRRSNWQLGLSVRTGVNACTPGVDPRTQYGKSEHH